MFSNIKPTFGTPTSNTSFGAGSSGTGTSFGGNTGTSAFAFGNSNSSGQPPFGQSTLFGKNTAQGFGQPQGTSFGQPSNSTLFPPTQNAAAPMLFGSGNAGFNMNSGINSTQPAFGANMFGSQQQQQQQPTSNTGFASSAFGQQNKPTFGFGNQVQNQPPPMFGQQAQQASAFQAPGTSGLFGGSGFNAAPISGTTVKFTPVTGTDTMQKNGVSQSISTKHHCITCMKEYETKSLEELRWEDYQANRKGPQAGGFPNNQFSMSTSTAPTLFNQAENKTPFGQTSSGFGAMVPSFGQTSTSFSLNASQSQAPNLFGKTQTFVSTAPGFGTFGATSQPSFGLPQSKPFGPTPLFGNMQQGQPQTSGFGTTGLFGQNTLTQNSSNMFKPPQTTNSFNGFGSNLFQPPKTASGGFGPFAQPSTTNAFGQNAFGQQNQPPLGSAFGKPLIFGQNTQMSFLSGSQTSTLFSNTQQKPSSFFGNSHPFGGLGMPFDQHSQNAFQQGQLGDPALEHIIKVSTLSDQFGRNAHLERIEPLGGIGSELDNMRPANNLLKNLAYHHRKDHLGSSFRSSGKLKPLPYQPQKLSMFDDLTEEEINTYYTASPKRLIVKDNLEHKKLSAQEESNDYYRVAFGEHREQSSKATISTPFKSISEISVTDGSDKDFPDKKSSTSSSGSPSEDTESDEVLKEKGHDFIPNAKSGSFLSNEDWEIDLEVLNTTRHSPPPCGVILTRPEYYTLPPLDELKNYVNDDGSCLVKGFTIGRRGYGNVYFPDEIDICNLNLDEIIFFRSKEIHLYPDESKKPPVNEGLNRRAQVTLDRVYPRVRGTKDCVTDVKAILASKFSDRLRDISNKHNMKFIDYRPETGSWVFMVDHFSKYGLSESDEETCELGAGQNYGGPATKHRTIPYKKYGSGLLTYSDDNVEDSLMDSKEDDSMDEGDILHNSFKMDMEDMDPTYSYIEKELYVHRNEVQMMKAVFFDALERDSNSSFESEMSVLSPDESPIATPPKLIRKTEKIQPTVVATLLYSTPEYFPDYSDLVQNRCMCDLALFKGKSFRVGWTKSFQFYSLQNSEYMGSYEISKMSIKFHREIKESKEWIVNALKIARNCSMVTYDFKEMIPTFDCEDRSTYISLQSNLALELPQLDNVSENNYFVDVWTLCYALWGRLIVNPIVIKARLIKWLKDIASNFKPEKSKGKEFEIIFDLLLCRKIEEAANFAMEHNMPQLALLVSQINLSPKSKTLLHNQLKMWYNATISEHFDVNAMKIYSLLAGVEDLDQVVFSELDWKQALGIFLNFKYAEEEPLRNIVNSYTESFKQDKVVFPHPPYSTEKNVSKVYDLLYQLLVVYSNPLYHLMSALNPLTYTTTLTDYRLSWLLFLLLKPVARCDEKEAAQLHINFSSQLEHLGLWEWAIFPLLYLTDNGMKKQLIINILSRHLPAHQDEKLMEIENYLITDLYIPQEWICMVKMQKNSIKCRVWQAYFHGIYGNFIKEANSLFAKLILPQFVLNEFLGDFNGKIEDLELAKDQIANWDHEVGLVSRICKAEESFAIFIEGGENAKTVPQLWNDVLSIVGKLKFFPVKDRYDQSCLAELSRRTYAMYMALQPMLERSANMLATRKVSKYFIMPQDYFLSD